MNCDQFQSLLGMRCEPMPTRDGSQVIAVVTQFTFRDGDGIEVFAESLGGTIRLFDDGLTMYHLRSVGLRMESKKWHPIRSLVRQFGVTLNEEGTFETLAPTDKAPAAFARFLSALLAVAAWESDHEGVPTSARRLQEEAALHLRAWKPSAVFSETPEPLIGFSGKKREFHFRLGDEYVDVLQPNGNSTGAELRKLIDVRSNPIHRDQPVRVIVDDRRSPDHAREELSILGRVATAWPMSALVAASVRSSAVQH